MALLTNINGKFSVSDAGAVRFNDAFTFPTADGDANYVLKTNGSGQLAWGPDNDSGGDITGSGTANTVTKFTGAKVIGDGPITFATNDSTFAGTITASKNQNATSNFTFQNTDTTGTSVRTHLNATAGNRSIRLEAIHNDYSYVVSNNARIYLQTNSGSNNPLFLDGDNGTFAGDVTANANYTAGNSKIIYKAQRSGGAVAGDWSYDDATTDMSLGTSTAHSFSLKTGNTRALTINTSQNATFAKNVGVGGVLPSSNGGSGATLLGVHDGVGSGWSVTKYTNTTTGTAAGDGSIFGIIGSDAYIFNYEAGNLFLATNSVNRLTIDSSGNSTFAGKVVVGKDSSNALEVFSSGDTEIGFSYATQGNIYAKIIGDVTTATPLAGELAFQTATGGTLTERMRIDSSGNVGIGMTPIDSLDSTLQVSEIGQTIISGGDIAGKSATFAGTGGVTNSSIVTIVSTNTSIVAKQGGEIGFAGKFSTGSNQFAQFAKIMSYKKDTTSGNYGGGLQFWTRENGTPTAVKMTIDPGGNVGIGTINPTNGKLVVDSTANQIAIETGTAGDGRLNIGHFSNGTFIGTYGDDGGAADLIRFGTHSGDERMRIWSAGMIQIGSDSSSTPELLTVQAYTQNQAFSGKYSAGGYLWFLRNETGPSGRFQLMNAGSTTINLEGNTTRDNYILGDLGIGTTSPTAKLDINGTVRYRGNTYNQLTYQVSGNYSANTWYTIVTNATLTEQGIYILVAYVEDFTAGGANYYIHACSTNFYWDTTSTNRTTAFNFPALLGTGHATGSLPLIRITQELGTSGAQSKIQWQTPYTYTGLNPGLGGKKLIFYFKRIGG